MFMSFSIHNSRKMHVHYFHFTGELSWIQKSYYIPKANMQLISNRDGVHIKVSLNPKSVVFTPPEAFFICIVLLPKLNLFFQLPDCISIGSEMGTCEKTCKDGQRKQCRKLKGLIK